MLNVLHFNYEDTSETTMNELEKALRDRKDIRIDSIPVDKRNELWDTHILDEAGDYEVLLIHPGVEMQSYVLSTLPKKFPRLRIGLYTISPESYTGNRGNVDFIALSLSDFPEELKNYLVKNLNRQKSQNGN